MGLEPASSHDDGSDPTTPVLAAVAPQRWAPSFFGVVARGSVRRRPSDALHLLAALGVVLACIVVTEGFAAHDDSFYAWLGDLPEWLAALGTALYLACTVGAVAVMVLALVLTRNLRLATALVVVGGVAAATAITFVEVTDLDAVRRASDVDPSLPAGAIAWLTVATAVLLAAAPYLVRPVRQFVRSVQGLALLGALLAAVGPLPSVLAAVGLGWAVSAATSLVIGTPRATPALSSVRRTLDDLGIAIDHLDIAERQTLGETRFVGRAPDGAPASVVVIGRDAADARLLSKLGRAVVFHDAGPSVSVSRSAQLEHRAYLLLMAAKAGVPVSEVVTTATGGTEDLALLALLEPVGLPLSDLDGDEVQDPTLDDVWRNLARLHAARLSHGQAVADNVLVLADGSTALADFSRGSTGAPPERCALDRVDLLASSAVIVGDERALAASLRSIGPDGLMDLLPLMETPALSPAARRAVPEAKKRLKALREAGAALCGQEVPELTELRRVTPSSILMAAATFLGFYLIVAQFAGVDLWATLSEADWYWVVVAALLSFLPQFSGSVALMGAVNAPLPFRPVLAEQFANNFTGLIGGTVATTALVIRFFQKQGLKVAVAASSAVMNSLASGIVQVTLVVVGLAFTSTQFVPSAAGGSDLGRLILLAIVVVGVAVSVALLVPKLRAALRRTVHPQVAAAKANLRGILTTPRKALMIFGGNLCSQVAYALVIDAALRAYGTPLPLLQIIVINSLASVLGGVAPVPGGMGVIEAGLIAGMTAAGVPQSEAVAATFTARLFTAYLPPIWGWVALQWLRRRDYV